MPMSIFTLHDLCPSDSFTKFVYLLAKEWTLNTGKLPLGG